MLQRLTSTAPHACDDSDVLPEDQPEEVAALDSTLDEAGWLALLIKLDQEEGEP